MHSTLAHKLQAQLAFYVGRVRTHTYIRMHMRITREALANLPTLLGTRMGTYMLYVSVRLEDSEVELISAYPADGLPDERTSPCTREAHGRLIA